MGDGGCGGEGVVVVGRSVKYHKMYMNDYIMITTYIHVHCTSIGCRRTV